MEWTEAVAKASENLAMVGIAWAFAWAIVRFMQGQRPSGFSRTSYMDLLVERERTIRECALKGVPVPTGAYDENADEPRDAAEVKHDRCEELGT